MKSPGKSRLKDSKHTSTTEELYQEYYKTFLEENKHIPIYSYHSERSTPFQLLTPCQPQLLRNYQTSLEKCILEDLRHIAETEDELYLEYETFPSPSLIPEGSPQHVSQLNPPRSFLPISTPMNEPNALEKRKASFSSIEDRPENEVKVSRRNIEKNIKPTLNLSISDSFYYNEIEDSVLPCSIMASAPSDLAPFPTPPPTDYTSDIVVCTCPENFEYNSYPYYIIDPNMTPALYSVPCPTPPPIDCDVASTCCSETFECYSYPFYSANSNIVPASDSASIPTPPPVYYTFNVMDDDTNV